LRDKIKTTLNGNEEVCNLHYYQLLAYIPLIKYVQRGQLLVTHKPSYISYRDTYLAELHWEVLELSALRELRRSWWVY